MSRRMTDEEKQVLTDYLKSEMEMSSVSTVSAALAWGALQLAGRMFDHSDVYDCKESAELSMGRKMRRPF